MPKKEIDIKKCRMACDLVLASMSSGHDVKTKLDYYHELVSMVDDYDRIRRELFGLRQTVDNMKRKEEKTYSNMSWKNDIRYQK